MSEKKVLMLEDDEDTLMLYEQFLGLHSLSCEGVKNAREVDAYFASDKVPCLVLMDLSVPGVDSEEFLKRLRSTPRLADVPVILVSGRDGLSEKAKTFGVVDSIMKPVDGDDLVAKVRRFKKI